MSPATSWPSRDRVDDTIRVLCIAVEERIRDQAPHNWCAYDLRKELVACILGSQVRREMAVAATENLEHVGLLEDAWWSGWQCDDFATEVSDVLSGQRPGVPHKGAYRFAKTRTDQLTRVRQALVGFP